MSFPTPDPETGMEAISEDRSSNNKNKFYVIGGIVTLALAATVVGGVCGSGKCKRSSALTPQEPIVVAGEGPLVTNVPSVLPSDFPSDQPSDVPSNIPSGIPTFRPTPTPSLRPTSIPTRVPTVSPTAAIASEEEAKISNCNLLGCFLRNLDTNTEVLLNAETSYDSTALYSIRCDFESISYVDFFLNDSESHREYNAPYWMKSNDANWIEPEFALTDACKTSVVRVVAASIDDDTTCIDQTFRLTPHCDGDDIPSPAPVTAAMDQVVAASLEEEDTSVNAEAQSSALCRQDVKCYLRDLDSEVEILLDVTEETVYAMNDSKFSVRCEANTSVRYIDFFNNGTSHRENNAPYWMNSNSGADWVEPVGSLSVCGSNQEIQVEVVNEDESSCKVSFKVTAECE